jgi:hypothetical protein
MIEINNESAFTSGYHTRWHCRRCNQEVPNEREYVTYDGKRAVLRSIDLVHDASILAQVSTCRLIIIVVAAVLVGALTVGTMDRLGSLDLATAFQFHGAVMDLIRGVIALFGYGVGASLLGMLVDHKLTEIIQIRAFHKRPL